jgi:predicted dehydrogenase
MVPRVALIGANGHGLWHRRVIAPLHESGRLRLVGLCDVRPIESPPEGVALFTGHVSLLREARPDVVIVCTPPHTHLSIATDVLRGGCDVLLEKPPVLSLAQHHALSAVLDETGRACQVGFQALGSAALARLREAVAVNELGTLTGVGVAGSWQRDEAYYHRAPWVGKRTLHGQPVLDGALANPFAHAVMQSLAVVDKPVVSMVEVERFRVRPIEVEDTACLRITLESGLRIVIAVTLSGEDFIPGEVIVDGTAGRAVLEYPTDKLRLPGEAELRHVPGRVGLLENLLDHRADRAVPLVAPLSTTEPFTAVLEAIQSAPEPERIDDSRLEVTGEGPTRRVTIAGINDLIRRSAESRALFSELERSAGLKTHCK